MSIENIFLSIILSTIISLIFFMLIAAIAAPFRHKLKKENVINVESKINNNSNIKWLIIHFSCICIFIVYYLPVLFYCFYKSVDCIILKILLLLFNVVSIYVVMWIMDSSLFKSKEKVLDTNIKNLIYLLTLIVAFITLVIFGLLNFGDLINGDEDTDDFLEYMIAPLGALIGNIIPLKSVYSVKGAKKEIYENIEGEYFIEKKEDKKGEYFIEKKEDKKRTYCITLSINAIIALFFIFDKLIYIWDNTYLVSIVLGIGIASLLVRLFKLME